MAREKESNVKISPSPVVCRAILADRSGMFDWKPQYSVGIETIDTQHQNLFAIGRELYAAMSSGKGTAATGNILDRLIQYTKSHFAAEEALMRKCGYPDYPKHKKEHDELTKQVLEFQADFKAGRVAMSVQLLDFLTKWLQSHIQVQDAAYAPVMKSKAVA